MYLASTRGDQINVIRPCQLERPIPHPCHLPSSLRVSAALGCIPARLRRIPTTALEFARRGPPAGRAGTHSRGEGDGDGRRAHIVPARLSVVRVLVQRRADADDGVREHDRVLHRDAHREEERPAARRGAELAERRRVRHRHEVSLGIEPELGGHEGGEDAVEDAYSQEGEGAGDPEQELSMVGTICSQ